MISVWRQGLQRSLADHHAAANAGKAIGERLFDIEDAQIVHVRAVLDGHRVVRLPEQVDQHPVVRPTAPGRDRDLQHRDHQPGADDQGERQHRHVKQPQRPAESLDLAGDGRRRPTVQPWHEQPAGDRDARAECREDRCQCDGLPEHDRGPRCPHRPRRTRQQSRNGSDQKQRDDSEGQRGHADSLPQGEPGPPLDGWHFVLRLQLGEGPPQRGRLIGTDPLDEMHECGFPAARVRGLVERIDHQPGDQFVAAMRRRVPVCTIVAMLDHEVLLRQPLKHGHDRGVRQVALGRQCLVYLAHGLGLALGPQVVHHSALQIP